jgi:Flp pilus assembly pilin Flp
MHMLAGPRGQAGQALSEFALVLAMVAVIILVVVLFLSGELLVIVNAIGNH